MTWKSLSACLFATAAILACASPVGTDDSGSAQPLEPSAGGGSTGTSNPDGGTSSGGISDGGTNGGGDTGGSDGGQVGGGVTVDAGTPSDAGSGPGTETDGGVAGGGGLDAGSAGGSDGGSATACLAQPLANWAGKSRLWLGADLDDATEANVSLDVRAQYIAGGYPSSGICSSCGSCDGDWWGCWSGSGSAPGTYVRHFVQNAQARGELPWFTYYEILQASGASEGNGEVQVTQDATFMRRYFDDFRFFLQQLGGPALIHLEPDLWGYAEKMNGNPHQLPSAVATANPTDCADQENSFAGFGRCMVAMVRKYAPQAKVGLQASPWGTARETTQNRDPSFDVKAEARKLAAFLAECGEAQADFIALDSSDRDAGWYQAQGKDVWWDATNATLPSFQQAFAWEAALTTALGKPAVWWQTPYGNMALPDQNLAWKDNRLDYFFDHPAELVAANTVGFVFGAGESHQTRADTDSGHFVQRAKGYAGPAVCP